MFFTRTDRALVLAREGGPHRAAWSCPHAALQFPSPSRREICYARLERTLPETNRGRVVKLAAAVYRATWQMADDQSPWTRILTRSGHAAEPSKSTMKLQTGFLPSIEATISSTLPSDMGAISSIARGRAAYRNCRRGRRASILDAASAPIWLVCLIKVSRSLAPNRVPRCADWRQKTYQPILFPTAQCCNYRHPTPRSISSTRSRFLDISTRAITLKVTGRSSAC